jgi:hypothetical protein
MVDYPSTYEEIMAFSRYSHSVEGVFEINEISKPPESVENSDAEDLDTSRVQDLTADEAPQNDSAEARKKSSELW